MKDFAGKNVYLTGGSAGIGLSTAKLLAARGAHIIIFARTKERLKSAVAEISACKKSAGQKIEYMELDVSDDRAVRKVMKKAVSSFGAPDLLINNAGRAYPRRFEDISFTQFEETMRTNLYGMWSTISALLPSMKDRGGHIVNVSSMVGFMGVYGYADYAASKFGIIGLSETLKSELAEYKIGISVLCPPDTDTPGFKTENITKPEETKAISAAAKVMTPDAVAERLVKGIRKKQFMIIPGFDGHFTWLAKRFTPWLVEWVMNMSVRKVQEARD
ncbi:MAG: SDR family NAD(P)-dependent oxidoreductase [Spirochaetes bacterium]|nr:MAG: SDR family NAD(P)-dependent oxidoreductase [Spirochaetota bacterium]